MTPLVEVSNLGKHFATHDTVNHGLEEYVRGDVTTKSAGGYQSIFKSGRMGD